MSFLFSRNIFRDRLLAYEYEYLLRKFSLSDFESRRVAEILSLAESNDYLDFLIKQLEYLLVKEFFDFHGEKYYKSQQCKLEESLYLIDYAVDLELFNERNE